MSTIRSALVDIEGVLCIGNAPIPGSIDALATLRTRGVGIRFVTNTTRKTRVAIAAQLVAAGFEAAVDEVVTGALAARTLIEAKQLRPYLLIHPGLMPDFAGLDTARPNAVVIGDAAEGFSYGAMNAAFRVLIEQPGAPLLALANNRYFRSADELALDAGPYVAALEYASQVRAQVLGKPAAAIFRTALEALGSAPGETVMIGDDIESDVGGAADAGLQTVLVRTGKYRPEDERHPRCLADFVADDFAGALTGYILPRLGTPGAGATAGSR